MLFADNLPNGHSIKSILIDNVGNIRKYYDGTDIGSQEILKKDIVYLLDNMSL
jgi:cytochrome oxidase Cu insertion factor (SCO1/SenC/PrrC family)